MKLALNNVFAFLMIGSLTTEARQLSVPYNPPVISPSVESPISVSPELSPDVVDPKNPSVKVDKFCGLVKSIVPMGEAMIKLQVVALDKANLVSSEHHYNLPYHKRSLLAGIDFRSEKDKYKVYCFESTSSSFTADAPGNIFKIYPKEN